MGKLLGYTVVVLTGAFFLFGPAFGLYLVSNESVAALAYSGRETGVVTACQSTRVRARSSTSYITVPVVVRESGGMVYGTFDEIRFLYPCDALIGKSVSIRYDETKLSEARINTFHQMWFLPMIIGFVCFVFYGAIVFSLFRGRK